MFYVFFFNSLLGIAGFAAMWDLTGVMFAAGVSHPILLVAIGRWLIRLVIAGCGFILVFGGATKLERMILHFLVKAFGLKEDHDA